MGFVPNSLLTMARWPHLLRAFVPLAGLVNGPGRIAPETKALVGFVSTRASGCRYCQAHTSHMASRRGVSAAKLEAALEFETSPLFDAAERAALRYARDASLSLGAVTSAHHAELRKHFDEAQIVELTAVVALFGFLNRWNDALATTLEPEPLAVATARLSEHGWSVDKHGA
ncbi:MAG TPA: carboxymuconolactone decarboxylase family protein [Myxococcota bacterium]|nr:carboxymuconolactone decarboxylase family protein [Myxococcota bacterium]